MVCPVKTSASTLGISAVGKPFLNSKSPIGADELCADFVFKASDYSLANIAVAKEAKKEAAQIIPVTFIPRNKALGT